jgi:glycerophosphoryl diester phosphodiesterase
VTSPTIYAHRGACAELPENTLEAFALARDLGAGAIETDAHMTRDGRIVLAHDASGERTAGVARAIRDLTLSEVRRWDVAARFVPARPGVFTGGTPYRIPLLEEALEAVPALVFNVDAKQTVPDMIPALLRAIRGARAEDRVRIASFSGRNLARVRALGYPGETALSPSEVARIMFVPRPALRWLRPAGHAAQVPRRAYGVSFTSQQAIDRLHEAGVRVDFWTIDDAEEAAALFARGADGVMTDDIRALTATVTDRRGREAPGSVRSDR